MLAVFSKVIFSLFMMVEQWNATGKPSKPFLEKQASFLICRIRDADIIRFVKIAGS